MQIKSTRNKLIDSTRGACIAMVIFYHFNFSSFFNKNGLYGVLIFFIISGYCMVNSIQTSKNFLDFLRKRLFRLMPALLICATLTTITKNLFPQIYPENFNSFSDCIKTIFFLPFLNLPSKFISFIEPGFNSYKLVDGSYWSLVVEFKFYYLLGIIYFFFSKKYYPNLLILSVFILLMVLKIGSYLKFNIPSLLEDFAEYLPYFMIGIGLNQIHFNDKQRGAIIVLISILFLIFCYFIGLSAFSLPFTINAFIATIFSSVWVYHLKDIHVKNWYLNNFFTLLAFVGKVSYPLYLLHQEMGLILVELLALHLNLMISKLIVIIFLVILAYLINKYFENILSKNYKIKNLFYATK